MKTNLKRIFLIILCAIFLLLLFLPVIAQAAPLLAGAVPNIGDEGISIWLYVIVVLALVTIAGVYYAKEQKI